MDYDIGMYNFTSQNKMNVFLVQVCAQDGQCRKTEKCCYDSCLEHHACKPIGVRTG